MISFRNVLIIGCVLILASCSTTPLHVSFQANGEMNQDTQGQSLPVLIKVYQLRNPQRFENATFADLWQTDHHVLGSTLVNVSQATVSPSSEIELDLAKYPQAHYLGVLAIFRQPGEAHWRLIKPLKQRMPLLPIHLKIQVKNNQIQWAK